MRPEEESNSVLIKRLREAIAPAPLHGNDKIVPEVKVFVVKPRRDRLSFERIPSKALAEGRRLRRMREIDRAAAELRAQIKQSFDAYLRRDVRPVGEFLAELELKS